MNVIFCVHVTQVLQQKLDMATNMSLVGGDFPSGTQENFGNCTWYVTTQQKAAYVAHTKQI